MISHHLRSRPDLSGNYKARWRLIGRVGSTAKQTMHFRRLCSFTTVHLEQAQCAVDSGEAVSEGIPLQQDWLFY